jgi:hypothetical protein
MRLFRSLIITFFILFVSLPAVPDIAAQQVSGKSVMHEDCPMMKEVKVADMNKRGDQTMGFSQDRTTHHFLLNEFGGQIKVEANDAADLVSRDQIRVHLKHLAAMFADGNFSIPSTVHNGLPPGSGEMQRLKDKLLFQYEETARGGIVHIKSNDPVAVAAVHNFLRFQVTEHRTGDPLEVH